MFSKFFIERPIFAAVISIVIVLLGLICLPLLPVEKTPDITPPTVSVEALYPGANAEVLAQTVATPLEEAINGVDRMIYMTSSSSDNGMMRLTATFEVGTDVDMATILVQNRVATAEPLLPEEVKRYGIKTQKQSTNMVMIVSFLSPDGRYDGIYLSNFITLRVKDVLSRVPGVGSVQVFGSKDFGMRIWLNPARLKAHDLTTDDVLNAIREQNIQVAAGQIGGMPSPADQQFQYTVKTLGRLSTVQEFEDIIVHAEPQGRLLRVKDVARVELGSQGYFWYVKHKGTPSVAVGIYPTPQANALNVVAGVREALTELSKTFPEGLTYKVPYNPTLFIEEAIREVAWTLITVVAMVVLCVFIFLADWRATLVPAVVIPVSLIGTFAAMAAMGMTINTLSLFGLVLSIGIVVDDAIVVVENCARLIAEEKLAPKAAAIKAMEQVTGPVIATTLVLLAVFVPTVLVGGITGKLYQQFVFTLSIAVCLSTLNALTLSPAMCALLLRGSERKHGAVFQLLDRFMQKTTAVYGGIVKTLIRRTAIAMGVFAVIAVLSVAGFKSLPTGFLPSEDEGTIFIGVRLPDGATLLRTEKVTDQIDAILKNTPGVREHVTVGGFSMLDGALMPNGATCFVNLEPWSQRKDPEMHVRKIIERLQAQLFMIPDAFCLALQPPAIMGLGMTGGFEVKIQDRGGAGLDALAQAGNNLLYQTMDDPVVTQLNSTLRATVPQLYVDVDRVKAQTLDVPLGTVFNTLQTYLGSSYVNDFNLFGRTFKVIAQAEPDFRATKENIGQLEVRNRSGQMLPIQTLAQIHDTVGPQTVTHYNLYPSTTVTGNAKPGFSSGQAIKRIGQLLDESLPPSMGYEWSGMSLQEIQAGGKTVFLFVLGALFAYLFLAAQYESWTVPVAIVLAVPLGLLGAAAFTWIQRYDNNIYTQMGILLLIGVVTKTAILLVEFAKKLHEEEDYSITDAAVYAARLRFRPILMTALTDVFGTAPMVFAIGAGAAARRSLGSSVFGGMIVATLLGVFLIPILYVAVQWTKEKARDVEKAIEEKVIHHQE
ncbi:MAG: multidrug efflux RND transporter permease subunit [Planctomycetales bacterium]|nr:multidrug efflux RND transporter permease subunit [Planctomycetales bacterium]